MARVLALTRDLLFGSRVQGALAGAGHEVELLDGEARLRDRLAGPAGPAGSAALARTPTAHPSLPRAVVLVVDLTDPDLDGAAIVEELGTAGELGATRTLAFYSHVDTAARERAGRAGFDLIVPRSRLAREAPELVARLLDGD